jgi:hypothetical protein
MSKYRWYSQVTSGCLYRVRRNSKLRWRRENQQVNRSGVAREHHCMFALDCEKLYAFGGKRGNSAPFLHFIYFYRNSLKTRLLDAYLVKVCVGARCFSARLENSA